MTSKPPPTHDRLKEHPLEALEAIKREPFPSKERFIEIRNYALMVLPHHELIAWWQRPDVQQAVARGWNE